MAETHIDTNPLHQPAVEPPNSAPTGSRVYTFTESYAAGYPNIPEPRWITEEALIFAIARASAEIAREAGSEHAES